MDFSEPPRRPRAESIVPMINVVFLLLIFFLMTSNLAKPEPFDVTPPESRSDVEPQVERILYVHKSGRTSFEGIEGESALTALQAASAKDNIIQIRADADLEASAMARLLTDLAQAGFHHVELVVAQK